MNRIAMIAALTLGLTGLAQAQNSAGGPQSTDERFKRYDANGDGKVSLDEYKAGRATMGTGQGGASGRSAAGKPEDRFRSLDTNKDNFLSLDEYRAGRTNTSGGSRGREKT